METIPDTNGRKPTDSTVQPSEPRIQVAPDVRDDRETLPSIPVFPHDTIPAPPLAEHDEPED